MATSSNACPLCLTVYTKPKFLPCFHTFCEGCIDQLAHTKRNRTFPCPSCRKITTLPLGGAAALQTNFYMETPTTIQDQLMSKLSVSDRKKVLQNALSDIEMDVEMLTKERSALDEQRAAVEKSIQERHNVVLEALEKHTSKQLDSLQSAYTVLDKNVAEDLKKCQTSAQKLSTLLQQVDDVINSETSLDVSSIAKKMRGGFGSEKIVDAMISREERPLSRPDLCSHVSSDLMIQTVCDYVGHVNVKETKVTLRFQCSQDPDTQLFSLCHQDGQIPLVLVSYERLGNNINAPVQKFTESGECIWTFAEPIFGRLTNKRYAEGKCMFHNQTVNAFRTYCKSPMSANFTLSNFLSGNANIMRDTVTSKYPHKPLKTKVDVEFAIHVGRHRAFDVDETERYFAVVEEANTDNSSCRVLLFKRPNQTAISTYQPPTRDYQPTDVLFYNLGGQPALIIADKLNSALHVVTFQGGQLKFERYLCQGCPLLKEPTALTVDVEGRVWVGVNGGGVLMIENVQ